MGIVRIPMRLSNRWIIGGLASIFGLVVGVPPAAGTVVTIAFSGELTFVEDGFDLSDPIEVGTAFSGRYSFDPDGVTDTQPDDPRIGSYPFPTGFMSVRVGDNVFESLGIHLAIWNNLPAGSSDLDIYQAGMGPLSAHGIDWHGVGLDFRNLDSGPFSSDALLTTAPDLNDFGSGRTFLARQQGLRDPRFAGEVHWIAEVPEPAIQASVPPSRRATTGRFVLLMVNFLFRGEPDLAITSSGRSDRGS
jgi:hypothetical protein